MTPSQKFTAAHRIARQLGSQFGHYHVRLSFALKNLNYNPLKENYYKIAKVGYSTSTQSGIIEFTDKNTAIINNVTLRNVKVKVKQGKVVLQVNLLQLSKAINVPCKNKQVFVSLNLKNRNEFYSMFGDKYSNLMHGINNKRIKTPEMNYSEQVLAGVYEED